jgi:ribosomal protein S18 acetylase RimI-like enzyme
MLRFDRLDRERLLPTFLEAFSDYAVDVSHTTRELKEARARKNNVDWELSPGVFDGDRMVAFTLIAVDDHQGRPTAFDAATGVVPGYRGRGLAGRMLEYAFPELRRRGVRRFLLEVLQQNEPAIRAYRRTGFEIVRELACFRLEPSRLEAERQAEGYEVEPIERDALLPLLPQMDWTPSWENGPGAIARIPDDRLRVLGARRDGNLVGAVVHSPLMAWLLLLVVHREHRRRGVASTLLRELVRGLRAGTKELRLANVDGGDAAMLAFVERRGFTHTVDQFEMAREI